MEFFGKKEFVNAMAEQHGITKTSAADMYDKVFATLYTVVSEGKMPTLPNIGKFYTVERTERQGRNPKTGEPLFIPSQTCINFKITKSLKDAAKAVLN